MIFRLFFLIGLCGLSQAQDLRRHRKQRFVVPNLEGQNVGQMKTENERNLLRQEVATYWTRLLQGDAPVSLSIFSIAVLSVDPFSVDPFSIPLETPPTPAPVDEIIELDIEDDFEVVVEESKAPKGKHGGKHGGKMSATRAPTASGKGDKGGKMSASRAPVAMPAEDGTEASKGGKGGKMGSKGDKGGKMSSTLAPLDLLDESPSNKSGKMSRKLMMAKKL